MSDWSLGCLLAVVLLGGLLVVGLVGTVVLEHLADALLSG